MMTAGIDYIITAFFYWLLWSQHFFGLIYRQIQIIVKIKMNGWSTPWVVKTEA